MGASIPDRFASEDVGKPTLPVGKDARQVRANEPRFEQSPTGMPVMDHIAA